MSAYIGLCLENGAFLSADSRRVNTSSGEVISNEIKKIHPLNDKLLIATGGLGTIGHEAREELTKIVQADNVINLEEIISATKAVFSKHYKNSFNQGNVNIPLSVIIAGQKEDGKGIIYAMKSGDEFEPLRISQPGQPYFTGSNTKLVVDISSTEYFKLKKTGDIEYNLDEWSYLSFKEIVKKDSNVGFPIQFVIQKDKFIERTINLNSNFKKDNLFRYRFIY